MNNNDKNKGWVNVDDERKAVKESNSQKSKPVNERASFEVDGEVYTPYALSKTYKFPLWIKACFAKWWFPGMAFYFIFFGLGNVFNQDILALILGIFTGVVTDIFLNNYFRGFSSPNHDYTKYILCGKEKKFWTIFVNIGIYVVLSFLSSFCIIVIQIWLTRAGMSFNPDEFMFSVGALIYATFMLLFDLLFVLIKNSFIKLINRSKNNSAKEEVSTETDAENKEN